MKLSFSRGAVPPFPQTILRLALVAIFALTALHAPPAHAQQPLAADIYFGGTKGTIQVYAAARDGSVKRLPDAKAPSEGLPLASTGNFLFTAGGSYLPGTNEDYIHTFHRTSDGTLHYLTSTFVDTSQLNQLFCGFSFLTLDHTGTTLYAQLVLGGTDNLCQNSQVVSFSINKTTGALTPITSITVDPGPNQLFFTGNNTFAYGAFCSPIGGWHYQLTALKRLSVGDLQFTGTSSNFPALPAPYTFCPTSLTADPANHLTVALMQANTSKSYSLFGPPRIAVYSADANGTLTTGSTTGNMVTPLVSSVYDMAMDPRGELLAVSGAEGLQLFHAHGALQPTQYSNLIPVKQVAQLAWDKSNHLYAFLNSNELHIFTVTSSSVSEVTGSPYAIGNNYRMRLQPQGDQLPDVLPPACATTAGLKICSPSTESVGSPAFVSAAATAATGYITAVRVYVDGVAQVLVPSTTKGKSLSITQILAIPHGKHTLTVVGYQSNGAAVTARQTVTIP